MYPQEKITFVNTTTIEFDDFIGHKEELRIAPCRRCVRSGRFKAEYNQLAIRYKGLKTMLDQWDNETLPFEPTCPRSTYNMQIKAMADYLAVLEARAVMESIELNAEK